ncbi:MAG TPA: AAA family ATPase, partial [Gemmatimonadales bacterium]
MLPHFHLLTLGSPALLSAAGEQIRFRTRKHFAVLIRLALATSRRCTRAELMETLWPGVPERLARHSLAQAVTVVKAKLGRQHVIVQRASLGLADEAVGTDIDQLDNGAAEVRGRFLEGFEIPGSAAFEQWKDEWHARLLGRVRDALVRKMDAGRRIGEFATVERHARTLLELDPLSEDGVRGVMEARAWVGDRTNALKAFARYEAALETELGAKPSPDVIRMADLMRQGRRSPLRPSTAPEPVGGRAERRMEPETIIGRSREFSMLYDAWLDVRRRIPRVMVVTGDPGIGKTTLTNAFLSSCQMEGAVVARAQAYDAERELPYAVLAELVRQLTSQRAIGSADPEDLAELSRICADVTVAFPGVPKPPNWAAEVIPLRLADALLKTVKAASEDNPVILVIDDVHAADDSSVAILHMVARKISSDHLMIVLIGRPAEIRAADAPHALTTDPHNSHLQPVSVQPLPPEDAEKLVDQLARDRSAGHEKLPLNRILDAARGNPLALELLTRDWVLHGDNSLLRDIDVINTRPMPVLEVPRAIAVVFEREVRHLQPNTRSIMDLAAILGRRLADLELYSIVGAGPTQTAQCLRELVGAGILREVGPEIEFRNELIRAQSYYLVPGHARQQLHHQVAIAYVNRLERDP